MFIERLLMFIVGVTFICGGGMIARGALESKNLIDTSLFGLLGIGVGIFLVISAICGPPG